MESTSFTDSFGTPINIGDQVEFQVLLGYRKHKSKSKVYGIKKDYLLISCNGIRKEFMLAPEEVIKVHKSNQ
jgi:hypothetical protein